MSKHCSTEKDIWIRIEDKIYDFSGYAVSHPGGGQIFHDLIADAQKSGCGFADGTISWEESKHPKWVDGQLQARHIGTFDERASTQIEI